MTEPAAALACRLCGAAMTRLPCGPVTLDRCDHCGGLWFDGGELDSLLEGSESLPAHAPKGSAARSADALIVCPRCTGVTLEAVRRGAAQVHRCPSCHGVLVSRSSIEAILAAKQKGGGSAWSVSWDFGSGGSGGGSSGSDVLDENVIGAVLDFIGGLLEPLG
jgi:Zn-finger nucleic acid-binding protein